MQSRARSHALPYPMAAARVGSQALRYAGAGMAGTVVQYAMVLALVPLGWRASVASTLGALVGAAVNYLSNRRWVFRSARTHAHALPRFAAVAAVGVVVNGAIMWSLVDRAGVDYLLAQVVATGCVFVAGFGINRRWTF